MQSFRHQLRRNRVAVLAIFSIAALAACGTGENDTGPTAGDQQNNKIIRSIKNDSNVFAALHTSNLGEIAAAQIALTKATDTGVVAFARQMIIDHRMLDSSGTALANSLGIVPQLPDSTFPKATAAQSDTLNSMASGTAFDQTYIAEQINDHSLTLGIIDHSTAVSSDSTVQASLQNDVQPVVEMHLQMAQGLRQRVGSPPSADRTQ